MGLLEGKEKYCTWLKGFKTERLVEELYKLEKISDVEGFEHTLFVDDIDFLLTFIKDEIIKRVAIMYSIEIYNG